MIFDPQLAEIRFGCGLSPSIAPAGDMATILDRLLGPDRAAERFPVPSYTQMRLTEAPFAAQRQALRKVSDQQERQASQQSYRKEYNAHVRRLREESQVWTWNQFMRRTHTEDGFRERLAAFWADHFAASGKNAFFRLAVTASLEDTIRPHLAGHFADMVVSVMTQPLMLHYLDQSASRGPNSDLSRRRGQGGLNENLARELMELHTLGVAGPYTQADVTRLAELLAGLSIDPDMEFRFNSALAEPGAETVLGKPYGGKKKARLEDVIAVLKDLSNHEATAHHIARKLAVHFVSDEPSERLVDHMTARFVATRGRLSDVYAAMLEHPDSWLPAPANVKRPMDFIGSAMRLLSVPDNRFDRETNLLRDLLLAPLALMGQTWEMPPGPNGWPEEDPAWVSPQRLAARVRWAWSAPTVLVPELPNPVDLLHVGLGARADKTLIAAVSGAADRAEGIALLLCSPAFQRM